VPGKDIKMAQDFSKWTKAQFHAFVLVCGAHSNYEVTQAEKQYIVSRTGDADYLFAENAFRSCSDFECVNMISEGRKHFYPSEHDKKLLESDLRTLFAADHEFEDLEENFLRYIDKVL
jgi:hypothetical protein